MRAREKRERRQKEFEQPPIKPSAWMDVSPSILECTRWLLRGALKERTTGVSREARNHHSGLALGCVAMAATALDAWLSEMIWCLDPFAKVEGLRDLADDPIQRKYGGIPEKLSRQALAIPPDLVLLFDARDVIVHLKPRFSVPGGDLPSWLEPLRGRNVLFEPGAPIGAGYSLYDALSSYRLAYWACETVEVAAMQFVAPLSDQPRIDHLCAEDFTLYRQICPPGSLPEYDREMGLSPCA
jgi:hypothetical protein